MTDAEAIELHGRVPAVAAFVEYIKGQQERRHDLPGAANAILGRSPLVSSPSKEERRTFYLLQDRVASARRKIEAEDKSGTFELDPVAVGNTRVYRWRKK